MTCTRNLYTSTHMLRRRLSRLIYPYWTQTEIDAARWRGHQTWLALGFGVKHGVDEPCPAHAKASEGGRDEHV